MLRKNLLSKKGGVLLAMVLFFGAISFGGIYTAIAEPVCEGDFDYDSDVDGSDLDVFAGDFGRTDCPPNGPALVEKTGQITSYATGDDGDLEKGVAWPNPRFTDNGDGTVTDNLTGLIWLMHANYNDTSGTTGQANWANALAFCNALENGQCGLSDGSVAGDWRLPNIKELISLIDYRNYNAALPSDHPFTGVQFDVYWSGTTYAFNDAYAWYVYMANGFVGDNNKEDYDNYVWPVRGGN